MKNLDEALQELEEIINQQLDKHVIPVKVGVVLLYSCTYTPCIPVAFDP